VGAGDGPRPDLDTKRAAKRAKQYLLEEAPLAVENSGGDSTTYKVAARLKDFGLDREQAFEAMAEHWNERCSPPWQADDLLRKISNAFDYGTRQPGEAAPEADFGPVDQVEPQAGSEPSDDAAPGSRAKRKLRRIPFGEIGLDSPHTTPLIAGWLDQGGTSMVVGATGSGKTFLALDLAMHVATGRAWHGRRVEPGGVVYVAAESPRGVQRRLLAAKKHHKLSDDLPFDIIPEAVNLAGSRPETDALIDAIREAGAGPRAPVALVVIDTLARAAVGADENSSGEMGSIIAQVERIRAKTGAHVMVVHHLGKDATRGARGSSALKAAVDTEITVADFTAEVTKQRDGETGAKVAFELRTVVIGNDRHGALIEAPAVLHKVLGEQRRSKPLKGHAAAAYEVLRELIAKRGEPVPAGAGAPENTRGVPEIAWREAFVARDLAPKGRTKANSATGAKVRAFSRARARLRTEQRIQISSGFVWI